MFVTFLLETDNFLSDENFHQNKNKISEPNNLYWTFVLLYLQMQDSARFEEILQFYREVD